MNNMWLQETASCSNQDVEGEDGWSLFYSNSTKMAVQVVLSLKRVSVLVLKILRNSRYISLGDFLFYEFVISYYQHHLSQLCYWKHKVDDKKTVGPEAFARIAPACPVIADVTTVHNLFDVLTSSSGPRLHFLIYDKYLRSLEKYASLPLAKFLHDLYLCFAWSFQIMWFVADLEWLVLVC